MRCPALPVMFCGRKKADGGCFYPSEILLRTYIKPLDSTLLTRKAHPTTSAKDVPLLALAWGKDQETQKHFKVYQQTEIGIFGNSWS